MLEMLCFSFGGILNVPGPGSFTLLLVSSLSLSLSLSPFTKPLWLLNSRPFLLPLEILGDLNCTDATSGAGAFFKSLDIGFLKVDAGLPCPPTSSFGCFFDADVTDCEDVRPYDRDIGLPE